PLRHSTPPPSFHPPSVIPAHAGIQDGAARQSTIAQACQSVVASAAAVAYNLAVVCLCPDQASLVQA
ncbi:MAG: hypothetical protein OXU40_05655, partial [Nitrospira sp.]|nr:hypothetical protein [Nitrospira sp.]